jgi:hypothetical protein
MSESALSNSSSRCAIIASSASLWMLARAVAFHVTVESDFGTFASSAAVASPLWTSVVKSAAVPAAVSQLAVMAGRFVSVVTVSTVSPESVVRDRVPLAHTASAISAEASAAMLAAVITFAASPLTVVTAVAVPVVVTVATVVADRLTVLPGVPTLAQSTPASPPALTSSVRPNVVGTSAGGKKLMLSVAAAVNVVPAASVTVFVPPV